MSSYAMFSREWWQERLDLITSFCDGDNVSYNNEAPLTQPSFRNSVHKYSISKKPIINWDEVNPVYNYLAKDDNGDWYLYRTEPTKRTWIEKEGFPISPLCFKSFNPPDVDWDKSLHKRPSE